MQKILYLLLFISVASFGQSDKVELNANINNTKTDKHVNIPGTRIYIIPPKDCEITFKHIYFTKYNSYISVLDLMNINIKELFDFSSGHKYRNDKSTAFDFDKLKVNGHTAFYSCGKLDTSIKSYKLTFGEDNFTVSISAIASIPKNDNFIENSIIQVFNSVYFDINEIYAPYVAASFTINDSSSIFKFSHFMGESIPSEYYYRINGFNYKVEPEFETVFVKEELFDNNMKISLKDFAKKKITNEFEKDTSIKIKESTCKLGNNYNTHKVEINQKKGKYETLICQYFIKGKKSFITLRLEVQIKKNFDNYTKEFNKLVNTIRFK